MRFVDEFRDRDLALGLAEKISKAADGKRLTFMEVCGTHTVSVFRSGLRSLLPENVRLIAGPGCPVCVTPNRYIDKAIAYSRLDGVTVATFGDMVRVPGSSSSLEKAQAEGADVKVVYSAMEAVRLALQNPQRKVIFLGVGFETTAPTVAVSIKSAEAMGVQNYFVFCAHKLIPPAMAALVKDGEIKIDGFICPGHVSTVIGSKPYESLAKDYCVPCVIAGFEPLDVLQAIGMLIGQVNEGRAEVEVQYKRAVRPDGNPKAIQTIFDVFEPTDSEWRGIGVIPQSGLKIRQAYQNRDAEAHFQAQAEPTKEHKGCICGEVIKGTKEPIDCKLFGNLCTPENPIGPCMVSSEGTCAAYFRYSAGGQLAELRAAVEQLPDAKPIDPLADLEQDEGDGED